MAPPGRVLSVSRLLSRAGMRPTGVDRVELAYLARFLSDEVPLWGLARTGPGWLLLDRAGLRAAVPLLTGEASPPAPDLLSRLWWRGRPARAGAETALRRLAVGRARRGGLEGLLRRTIPPGAAFHLVGLSDLTEPALAAMRAHPGARISALIHDTIPLDHPDLVRAGAPARLRAQLDAVAGAGARVVANSQATADRLRAEMSTFTEIVAAPLGIDVAAPAPEDLPSGLDLAGPYFVALGTIEPRKEIGLLLDAWEGFGADRPRLYLCGRRGWRIEDVARRLDAGVPGVTELPGLGDGAVAALLGGARALLMPSRAEGFGLPPFEALAQGTLPVCCDLAIWQEKLGPRAIYLPPGDVYSWSRAILSLAAGPKRVPPPGPLPDWDSHFKAALGGDR
ncbi:glycosyltransferase [Wenxinia saemankumensis]|uniref:Glycosyltransferase involved in cell wall bisynthesis n=1 Tax=Wenxinia saemankumensis TaxID=1447782 RepID=A0A1M6FSS8_9RHOB|nr:glycosyltransferase [Wenxinia saemankumensis]SHJ00699.1 Glycosyltransferase involved in cell wall bisynthesis [Wenxinia saemankumensis]